MSKNNIVTDKTYRVTFPQGLYDLRQEPGERYYMQQSYPEIVDDLQKVTEMAREDLGDDLVGRKGENRRPACMINN